MNIREELLKFKNSKKKQNIHEQSVFSNLPGVQPDKMDYKRPIPDPDILPDCFSALLKSDTNMVSFNKNDLKKSFQKRMDNVDMLYDPNSPSDQLGIIIMKNGNPFCFVKK